MTGAERWRKWFDDFARDYPRIRLERRRKELQARHDEGPDDYLSGKPAPLPLPRFRVHVGDTPEEITKLRSHCKTNKPPTGRPFHERDVYLASKVLSAMRNEGLSETEAIRRVTETLGQFDGWGDPDRPEYDARRAARKSARERVYKSLNRYRAYFRPGKEIIHFRDANEGWGITPEEAGRRAHEGMRKRCQGLFSP